MHTHRHMCAHLAPSAAGCVSAPWRRLVGMPGSASITHTPGWEIRSGDKGRIRSR